MIYIGMKKGLLPLISCIYLLFANKTALALIVLTSRIPWTAAFVHRNQLMTAHRANVRTISSLQELCFQYQGRYKFVHDIYYSTSNPATQSISHECSPPQTPAIRLQQRTKEEKTKTPTKELRIPRVAVENLGPRSVRSFVAPF